MTPDPELVACDRWIDSHDRIDALELAIANAEDRGDHAEAERLMLLYDTQVSAFYTRPFDA